jgi:hypothetical protein
MRSMNEATASRDRHYFVWVSHWGRFPSQARAEQDLKFDEGRGPSPTTSRSETHLQRRLPSA